MSSAKQTALTIVGAGVGYVLGGPVGAMYGAQVGYSIGESTLSTRLPKQGGPRLDSLQQQVGEYGTPLGKAWGTVRKAGVVIWAPPIDETRHLETVEQGGKGAEKVSQDYETYTYSASFAVAFNDGEISAVRRIWCNEHIVYDNGGVDDYGTLTDDQLSDWIATKLTSLDGGGELTIYSGAEDQGIDPTIAAVQGSNETPAFRGTAYLVFTDLELEKYGNRRPQVLIEYVSVASDVNVAGSTVRTIDYSDSIIHPSMVNVSTIEGDGTAHIFVGQWDNNYTGDQVKYYKAFPTGSLSFQKNITIDTATALRTVMSEIPILLMGEDNVIMPSGSLVDGGRFDFSISTAGLSLSGTAHISLQQVGNNTAGKIALAPNLSIDTIRLYSYTKSVSVGLTGVTDSISISFFDIDTSSTPGKLGWILSRNYIYVIIKDGSIRQYNHNGTLLETYVTGLGTLVSSTADGCCVDADDENIVYFSDTSSLYKYDTITGESVTYTGVLASDSAPANIFQIAGGILIESRKSDGLVDYKTLGDITRSSETLDTVVSDLCTMSGLNTSQIDVTTLSGKSVDGFVFDSGSAGAAIAQLFSAYNFSSYEDENKIVFKLRDGGVDATVNGDDLATRIDSSTSEVLPYSRIGNSSLPRAVNVRYLDYENNYAIGTQSVQRLRDTSYTDNIVTTDLPLVLSSDDARRIAERMLNILWAARVDYKKFTLPLKYAYLVPTDIVNVSLDGVSHEIRLTSVTVLDYVECTGISNSLLAYSSDISGETHIKNYEGNGYGGPSEAYFMDIPPLRDQDDGIGFYIAAHGYYSGWRGCQVYSETNQSGYNKITSILQESAVGVVIGVFEPGVFTTIDYTNSITVAMRSGVLSNATKEDIISDRTINAVAIGTNSRWEIVQFMNATDNGDGTYTVSGFIRGLQGTETYASLHEDSDLFIVLDQNRLARVSGTSLNSSTKYRVVSFNSIFQSGTDTYFSNTGESVRPLSIIVKEVINNPDNSFTVTWERRGRVLNMWDDNRDVPLGEASEEYTVNLIDDDGVTQISSEVVTSKTASVSFSGSGVRYIDIAQKSEIYGPGEFTRVSVTKESILLEGSVGTSSQLTASSTFSGTFPASKAWDGISESGDTTNCWISSSANSPNTDGTCYLQWDFGTDITIFEIRACRRENAGAENFPKDIVIKTADDAAFTTNVNTVGSGTFSDAAFDSFSDWIVLNSPIASQYLRMEIHSMYLSGGAQTWVAVQEIQFRKEL